MRHGMDALLAAGTELFRPQYLGLLAEAYEKVERVEEGLSALSEALTLVDKTGERVYEAELYRLKGELLLAQEGKNQKRFPRCGVPTGTKGKNEDISEVEAQRDPLLYPTSVRVPPISNRKRGWG